MANQSQSLLAGAILAKRYIIEKILGSGGFGITYQGFDPSLKVRVAIKEYFPRHIAARENDGKSIAPFSDESIKEYNKGISSFLDEARIVAQFDHPNIVAVKDYFEENNTAYMVMTYIEGIPLNKMVEQRGGKIDFETTLNIVLPVFDALKQIHASGLIHRDVSPDNIYFTKEGVVKLLDFGAARFLSGEEEQNMTLMLKEGYAPLEQYSRNGNQGEWTDIYAFAATIYKILTGIMPPSSLDRMHGVKLITPSKYLDLPASAEKALVKAMSLRIEERFKTISEFRASFGTGNKNKSTKKEVPKKLIVALPILLVAGLIFFLINIKAEKSPSQKPKTTNFSQTEKIALTAADKKKDIVKIDDSPKTALFLPGKTHISEAEPKKIEEKRENRKDFAKLFKKALALVKENKVKEGEEILIQTCESDYGASCYQLGVLQKSILYFEKAKSVYLKECKNNNPESCLNLGTMIGRGEGNEKNEKKAVEFIEKSCEMNLSYGCYALAQIFENGMGVTQDHEKADDFYKKACLLGLKAACGR